jgi:hypothetical protein
LATLIGALYVVCGQEALGQSHCPYWLLVQCMPPKLPIDACLAWRAHTPLATCDSVARADRERQSLRPGNAVLVASLFKAPSSLPFVCHYRCHSLW